MDVYVTKGDPSRGRCGDTLSVSKSSDFFHTSPTPTVSTSSGDNLWMMLFIISALVATIIVFGAFQQHVVETQRFEFGSTIPQWIHVSLLFASLAIGIIGVGGGILACWNAYYDYKEKNNAIHEDNQVRKHMNPLYQAHHFPGCDDVETGSRTLLHRSYTIKHMGRPNFAEIFRATERRFSNHDVGVLVSGPESLQLDVAKECRNQSSNDYTRAQIFNFHSVSFAL